MTGNEPAFQIAPFVDARGDFNWGNNGMTKREWVATQLASAYMSREALHDEEINWIAELADKLIERCK